MAKRITALMAIRLTCLWCMGGRRDFVASCEGVPGSPFACLFHPYRMGRIAPGADRHLLGVVRAFCLSCAGGPGGVKDCSASVACEAKGFESCCLHPFRLGRSPHVSDSTRDQHRKNARKRLAQGLLPGVSRTAVSAAELGSLSRGKSFAASASDSLENQKPMFVRTAPLPVSIPAR